jgi:hypothetical protein
MGPSRTEKIFTRIYLKNAWGGPESRSGPGSGSARTELLRSELTSLIKNLGVQSILDLPCGDFNWMRHVDLSATQYIGADIVAPIIAQNNSLYAQPGRRFERIDMLRDPLPRADLILCRDGLVHFSFSDIAQALAAMKKSGSVYLLVTTFTEHQRNQDMPTGGWRPLNLALPPFCFPTPLQVLSDARPDGTCPDKALALYRLADLPQQLGRLRPAQSFRAAMERSLYNLQRIYQAAYRRTKAG